MSETSTLIARLEDQGCDRMPFTDDHKHCICRLTNEAAREITSLRAQLDEARRKAIEECAAIADRWTSPEQRLHGHGGAGAEILALLSESKS